ncbi:MAG: ribosomal protein S18-alanine N-acetyltransferase [Candidatus Thermoplasmatota archaeon]
MLSIRNFTSTDMFSVIKIASRNLSETYRPGIFNYFYESFSNGFLVAELDHKIIGFIIGTPINLDLAKILMLAVNRGYRHKKIGSKLVEKLLKIIINEGISKVELEVRKDNKRAINFYLKHDFKIVGQIKGLYQNGKDAYLMKKNLKK